MLICALKPSAIQAAYKLMRFFIFLLLFSGKDGMHELIQIDIFQISLHLLFLGKLSLESIVNVLATGRSVLRVECLDGKACLCSGF
jgi:hypothetical protein